VDSESPRPRPVIDTSVAHPARRYNYWLGGKDNFEADRKSGDELAALMPTVRLAALENRGFQRRVVNHLMTAGIRQFLDIGTGIPAPDNTHEVAQAIDPAARVVYVDNDPIVLAHARALMNSAPEGRTAYLDGDIREPDKILDQPELRATLDLDQPVGLLLIAVLHFVTDDYDVYDIVGRLTGALAPGSYVAITHGTKDFLPPEMAAKADAAIASGKHGAIRVRDRAEISRFFTNLDLLSPGVVSLSEWHPTQSRVPDPAQIGAYGAVGRLRGR
jgi:hypothetical protein